MRPLVAAAILAAGLHPVRTLAEARIYGAGPAEASSAMAMARAAEAAGDRTAARDWLGLAVAADPDWALPRVALADLLLSEGGGAAEAERAERLLERAERSQSTSPRLYRLLGEARARLGDRGGAAAAWAQSLALSDDPGLRMARAALLRDEPGRREESIAELERVRAARPGEASAHSLLAEAYEAAGRFPEAEAELRWLAAASPGSAAPLRRLARFLERAGEPRRAAEAEEAARAVERPRRSLRALRVGG